MADVTENHERRRGSWPTVILFNQLVSLELPDFVGVVLDFLEREAVQTQRESSVLSQMRKLQQKLTDSDAENSLEDGYEQVEQQYVGKE